MWRVACAGKLCTLQKQLWLSTTVRILFSSAVYSVALQQHLNAAFSICCYLQKKLRLHVCIRVRAFVSAVCTDPLYGRPSYVCLKLSGCLPRKGHAVGFIVLPTMLFWF